MASKTTQVTVIWLDGYNQERCETVRRVLRDMPTDLYLEHRWPDRYTHMITYLGAEIPATWGAGQWWAFADERI